MARYDANHKTKFLYIFAFIFLFFFLITTHSIYPQISPSDVSVASSQTSNKQNEDPNKCARSSSDVFNEYQEKLNQLALKCEKRGMFLEAKVTRSYIYQDKPYYFVVPILSSKLLDKKLPSDATAEQQSWYSALQRLRRQYSDETFAIAKRLGSKKQGYEVVACVLQTLFINPDHEKARQFFGYSLYQNEWRSQWEIRKIENGYVDDPTFGWVLEEHVEKYHQGKRFYKNQWISKEEEEKKILSKSTGWKIETEHFSILSRVSLERGVEIGRFLELYYQAWSRLFYPFIATENQWSARLYANDAVVSKRHQVILYRNRAEYIRELRKHDKHADQSIGGYFPEMRCIFVYEPDPLQVNDCFDLFPMLAHEATHQLFNECNIPSSIMGKSDFSKLAKKANFWGAEGVAITAETFQFDSQKNRAEIGGYQDVFRIQDAVHSLFVDKSYIPLRKFTSMSRIAFQSYEDLNLLYSQAAGLSFFLMFYKNGVYCNAYVKYLYMIYQGIDSVNSLELLTGKSFEILDKEYQEFMEKFFEK